MIQCAQTIQHPGLHCCLVVDPPIRSADDHHLRCLVVDLPLGSADDHHQLKYKFVVFYIFILNSSLKVCAKFNLTLTVPKVVSVKEIKDTEVEEMCDVDIPLDKT